MTAPFRFTTDQDVANAVIPKLLFWTRLPNRGLSSLLADPFKSLSLLWTALADAYANPMNLLLFLQSGLTSFGLNLVIGLGTASVVPTFNKDSAVCALCWEQGVCLLGFISAIAPLQLGDERLRAGAAKEIFESGLKLVPALVHAPQYSETCSVISTSPAFSAHSIASVMLDLEPSLDLCIALCKSCASLWLRIDATPSKNYNYEVLLTRALARINGLTVSFDTFYLYDRKRFAAHAFAVMDSHTATSAQIWELLATDLYVNGPSLHMSYSKKLMQLGFMERSVQYLKAQVALRLAKGRAGLEEKDLEDYNQIPVIWSSFMMTKDPEFISRMVEFEILFVLGQWSLGAQELYCRPLTTHALPVVFRYLLDEPGQRTYTNAENQLAKLCAGFPTLPRPSSDCIPLWTTLLRQVTARSVDEWPEEVERTPTLRSVCAMCQTEASVKSELKKCGRCGGPEYCSKLCQTQHWKQSHKKECVLEFPKSE